MARIRYWTSISITSGSLAGAVTVTPMRSMRGSQRVSASVTSAATEPRTATVLGWKTRSWMPQPKVDSITRSPGRGGEDQPDALPDPLLVAHECEPAVGVGHDRECPARTQDARHRQPPISTVLVAMTVPTGMGTGSLQVCAVSPCRAAAWPLISTVGAAGYHHAEIGRRVDERAGDRREVRGRVRRGRADGGGREALHEDVRAEAAGQRAAERARVGDWRCGAGRLDDVRVDRDDPVVLPWRRACP